MFDINSLRVDPSKANEGTWVDYRGGSKLKLAKFMNKEMQDFRARKSLEHSKELNEGGEAAEKVAEEITVESIAHFVLKDWSGFAANGEEVEYTPEMGIEILSNEEYSDFREDVINLASIRDNYRPEEVAEDVKKAAAS